MAGGSLFATAAYLLDWPALQTVMEQLAAHLEWLDLPAKSRASHAAALLQDLIGLAELDAQIDDRHDASRRHAEDAAGRRVDETAVF